VEDTKEKKPRGWYGQRVKELDVEFKKIREDLEQLLRNSPENRRLAQSSDHSRV